MKIFKGQFVAAAALLVATSFSAFGASPIPTERLAAWQGRVGIPGGIPSNAVYTTISPSGGDDTAAISSALHSCPANRVVRLGSGTFNINGLDWQGVNSGVVLRGSGPASTKILLNNGTMYMRGYASETALSTDANLTADAVKGTHTITVSPMPTWIRTNQLYIIDQLDDPAICTPTGQETSSIYRNITGNGARGLGQLVRVVAVNGTTITTEDPINFNFKMAQTAQIAKSAYDSTVWSPLTLCGLEDFTIEGRYGGGLSEHMIMMENADRCWVKNIVSTNVPGGSHVFAAFSYKCEIRDSWFGYGHYYDSGRAYGIALYHLATGFLIENNVLKHLHGAITLNYGTSSSVVGYNYIIDGWSDSQGVPSGSGQTVALSCHGDLAWGNLFEGNFCQNKILSDFTHGSGGYMNTYFRNRVEGWDSTKNGMDQTPVSIERYNRKNVLVGNVLGVRNVHTVYEVIPTASVANPGPPFYVYKMGYNINWGGGYGGGYDTPAVLDTWRTLNWDAVNNAIVDAYTNSVSSLPNSYYYANKPAWFGNRPWPAIDPASPLTAVATNIPAGYRYFFGAPPPTGPVNLAPIAKASASSILGLAPLLVTFSSVGSSDPEGAPLTYNWSFGDGTANSLLASVAHTFLLEGAFPVQLTVSDGTNISSTNITVMVGNQPPVAVATASATSGTVPFVVNFSSAGSSDVEGSPLTYNWSFGDGTANSTLANPAHTYSAIGVYTARLIVSDGGKSGTNTVIISVVNPSTGLVAAYSFDEGSGTVLNDLSGAGNHGTIVGGIWTTGRFGQALQFNGTSSLVTVADSASLDLSTGMTLEAWVYPTSLGGWRDIIYKANDIYFLEGCTPTGLAPCVGGTFSSATLYGTNALPLNRWSHLAATYDGVTMRLYVDGVQVSSRLQTGNIAASTDPLTIGGDLISSQFWAGRIDEVRVYNRALSAAQILSDKNTTVTGQAAPAAPANPRYTSL